MEQVQIYFNFFNKITIITNFLAFFFFPSIFSSRIRILIADPGGKINADSDSEGKMNVDPDPQPWWCDTLFHTKRPLKGQIFLSKERHAKPAFRAKIFAFQGNL